MSVLLHWLEDCGDQPQQYVLPLGVQSKRICSRNSEAEIVVLKQWCDTAIAEHSLSLEDLKAFVKDKAKAAADHVKTTIEGDNGKTLHMSLSHMWFDRIDNNEKRHEFRAATDYWRKRLVDIKPTTIVFMRGYSSTKMAWTVTSIDVMNVADVSAADAPAPGTADHAAIFKAILNVRRCSHNCLLQGVRHATYQTKHTDP